MYKLRIKDLGIQCVTKEVALDVTVIQYAITETLLIIRDILDGASFSIESVSFCTWVVLRGEKFLGSFTLIHYNEELHKDDLCDTRR